MSRMAQLDAHATFACKDRPERKFFGRYILLPITTSVRMIVLMLMPPPKKKGFGRGVHCGTLVLDRYGNGGPKLAAPYL